MESKGGKEPGKVRKRFSGSPSKKAQAFEGDWGICNCNAAERDRVEMD